MKRDRVLDYILRAAAVYLFVHAVMSVSAVATVIIQLATYEQSPMAAVGEDYSIGVSVWNILLLTLMGHVFQVVLYLIVGWNLFNGGSWLRRLFSIGIAQSPADASDA